MVWSHAYIMKACARRRKPGWRRAIASSTQVIVWEGVLRGCCSCQEHSTPGIPCNMESVLVPKKLLFTPPSTPSPTPQPFSFTQPTAARHKHEPGQGTPPTSSGQLSATRTQASSSSKRVPTLQQQPSSPQIVRYGIPIDPEPDAYFSRFSHTAVKRFGLLDLAEQDSSSESEDEEVTPQRQHVTVAHTPSFSSRTPGSARSLHATHGSARSQHATPPSIADISPVEHMMQQLKIRWQSAVEVQSAVHAAHLHDEFSAADAELAQELAQINDSMQRKQQSATQADVLQAAQQLKAREQKIQELQRSHDKAAALQQQQVAKLQRAAAEEEAKRQAEAAQQAAAAAAAAQAAAQKAAAEEAARKKAQEEEQAKQAAQAQKAAGPAAATAVASATQGSTAAVPADKKASAAARCMRCTPEAIAFEKLIAQRAAEVQDSLQLLLADDTVKKQRRDIEKKMTVHVQQISATQDQVSRKCGDVYQLIVSQNTLQWRNYALLMFATKVVKQWELVSLNNKAAFPLGTVLVKVSTQFPALMDITLAMMHRECCFSVPCGFAARDPASGAELSPLQLRRLLGYREIDDDTRPGHKVYEADDDFIKRVEGIMFLYGAIVQVPDPQNPHGFDYGWRWLARFLNSLPATRAAAKALIFFLRAAGYSLHGRFRGQFIKLLKCMYEEFLPELAKSTEPDIQAVRTLLEHYLVHGQYKEEPEGRNMPRIDISSYQRA